MEINKENLSSFFQTLSSDFQGAFDGEKPMLRGLVSKDIPSNGSQNQYAWGDDGPMIKEWVGDRQIENAKGYNWSIVNTKYEGTVAVSRDTLEDDSYGIYSSKAQDLGGAAAVHPDQLLADLLAATFDTVCYDGQFMLDDDHPDSFGGTQSNIVTGGSGSPWFLIDASRSMRPLVFQPRKNYEFNQLFDANTSESVFMRDEFLYGVRARVGAGFGMWQLIGGSKNTLNATNFFTLKSQMASLYSNDNTTKKLGIRPTHLLCAPSNESAARTLLAAPLINGGDSNIWNGAAQLVVCPWLA